MCGKKLVYTAHNISKEARDGNETWYDHVTLRAIYRLVDAIIVHTEQMKAELTAAYHLPSTKIHVVRHGINLLVPKTGITRLDARRTLGIAERAHVVLFFGYISDYKDADLLVDAVAALAQEDADIALVLAGQFKCSSAYRASIETRLAQLPSSIFVKTFFEFIPPERVEELFAAANCIAMPYRRIYQSGIIFLAYRFGIPIVATDVGNFREDILENKTGFLCPSHDTLMFADTLRKYFSSRLFFHQEQTQADILHWAEERYSWKKIGQQTADIYSELLRQS